MSEFLVIAAVAGAAALASPLGGLIAVWRNPTTIFMSLALGFAGGILLGTISFNMLPQAVEQSGPATTIIGFAMGLVAIYAFDLFIHRGKLAGEKSEQHRAVARFYKRYPPHGDKVTVLAGGTSAEEIIEGLTIGVGSTLQPGVGMLIALAVAADNLAEGLSIGELVRSEKGQATREQSKRILRWTGAIGAALFGATLTGWLLLHWVPQAWLGVLLASGGGGMFYLVAADLVPESEERHYQRSSVLAAAAGFLVSLVLARLT